MSACSSAVVCAWPGLTVNSIVLLYAQHYSEVVGRQWLRQLRTPQAGSCHECSCAGVCAHAEGRVHMNVREPGLRDMIHMFFFLLLLLPYAGRGV